MMCRYGDEAGGPLGATVVFYAIWQDGINNGAVISTDATGAMIQPEKAARWAAARLQKGSLLHGGCRLRPRAIRLRRATHARGGAQDLRRLQRVSECDATNVYDILERGPPKDGDDGVTLVGCWAHCRRHFFEAAVCKDEVGMQGLLRIRAIYAADNAFKKLPPAQRKLACNEHVRPLIDAFFDWIRQVSFEQQGRNLATKALGYAFDQEQAAACSMMEDCPSTTRVRNAASKKLLSVENLDVLR
jgi:hypothetical protein